LVITVANTNGPPSSSVKILGDQVVEVEVGSSNIAAGDVCIVVGIRAIAECPASEYNEGIRVGIGGVASEVDIARGSPWNRERSVHSTVIIVKGGVVVWNSERPGGLSGEVESLSYRVSAISNGVSNNTIVGIGAVISKTSQSRSTVIPKDGNVECVSDVKSVIRGNGEKKPTLFRLFNLYIVVIKIVGGVVVPRISVFISSVSSDTGKLLGNVNCEIVAGSGNVGPDTGNIVGNLKSKNLVIS